MGFGGAALASVTVELLDQHIAPIVLHFAEVDTILGPPWPSKCRPDRCEVQFKDLGVLGGLLWIMPKALSLAALLDRSAEGFGPTGCSQVVDGAFVNREEAHGRPVFGRHVGNRRPIGQWHGRQSRTKEFNKLRNHPFCSQQFGDAEHHVGRGGLLGEFACETHANDLGQNHRYRLPKHDCFRLNATDSPSNHTETIDHGGV